MAATTTSADHCRKVCYQLIEEHADNEVYLVNAAMKLYTLSGELRAETEKAAAAAEAAAMGRTGYSMVWGPLEIKRARRAAAFLPFVTLASLPDAAHAVIASFLWQMEVMGMSEVSRSFQAGFRAHVVRVSLARPPTVERKDKEMQEDEGCGVRPLSSLGTLCSLLRSTPRLEELSVGQDDGTVRALAAALKRATAARPWSMPQAILPCLKSLTLRPVGRTSLDALMFGVVRGALPVLEQVALYHWHPVDLREGLVALAASWEARMEVGYPAIKALRLSDIYVKDDEEAEDGPLPPPLQRSAAFSALERLELQVRCVRPFEPWLRQQRGLHHLRHVEFDAFTGVDELLEAIHDTGAPDMTSITICCFGVGGAVIRRMAESVASGCWRKLEVLEVKRMYAYEDMDALASLITAVGSVEACPRLHSLLLQDCNMQNGAVLTAMGHCDFSRLKELMMMGWQWQVTELRELFEFLWDDPSTTTHITDLHIDNDSDDEEVAVEFERDATLAKRFLHACQLGAFSALRTLNVCFTFYPADLDALAELLKSKWGARLEEIDLPCVSLTEGACEGIRRVASRDVCPKLTYIRLTG